MVGILILGTIGITVVFCQRKSKKACHSRPTEPSVHTTKNGEANGFVPKNYVREETKALLPERCTHTQSASSTNLKHPEVVSEHGVSKLEDFDTATTSSGKSERPVSYDTTSTGLCNIKAAFRQQEPDIAGSRRVTPGSNVLSAVKQQDGQGLLKFVKTYFKRIVQV